MNRLEQLKRQEPLPSIEREVDRDRPHPRSEELLAAIVDANQQLEDALRICDQLERIGAENAEALEVQERSRHDTRIDRTVSALFFSKCSAMT